MIRSIPATRAVLVPLLCAGVVWLAGSGAAQAFEFNGFGDMTYRARGASNGGGANNGFALGQLDLYATKEVTDRTDVLIEIVAEDRQQGGFEVDLERLQFTYTLSNVHRLRAGRFHTILGYWGHAYHHGAHLQTTIYRPFFLEFEDRGGALPAHAVGLWWSGRWASAAGRLETSAMVHNGSTVIWNSAAGSPTGTLETSTGGDSDNHKSVVFAINFRPSALEGLEVGASGQSGAVRVTDTAIPLSPTDKDVREVITAAHVAYPGEQVEFIAERYDWHHTRGGTQTSANAWYLQAGGRVGKGFLYMRYATMDAEKDDYFDGIGFTTFSSSLAGRRRTIGTAGVRLDIHYLTALKLELSQVDDDQDGQYETGTVQWTFAF
ncbi:MAG: hypothetical protein OEW11_01560 [Nitrospirota bacterium]|nr:hypothetical protein [Nitrospirota bacterium]